MRAAAAHAAAEEEGLTLLRAENATGFKGVSRNTGSVSKPFQARPTHGGHHKSLTYGQLPVFFDSLRQWDTTSAYALQLTILTAARTTEVRLAKREEFDLNRGVWVVPEDRMKGREMHRVPLSPFVVGLVVEASTISNFFPYGQAFYLCVCQPHGSSLQSTNQPTICAGMLWFAVKFHA